MVCLSMSLLYYIADLVQESPHEHQQSLLLSRIITNVVRAIGLAISYGAHG